MNGKVIDSGANSIPLVLLPLAFIIIIVFVAWPLLIAIFVFALGLKIWERIRLQQLSEEIDPYFNQLIQAHQGCLTVLDLTNKTELKPKTARWYLDQKAEEYGAVKRLYDDKGIVYYFLTASTLGSILDDSEPDDSDIDEDINTASLQSASSSASISLASSPLEKVESVTVTSPETKKPPSEKVESVNITPPETEKPPSKKVESVNITPPETKKPSSEKVESVNVTPPKRQNPPSVETISSTSPPPPPVEEVTSEANQEEDTMSLNQSDLAKRLEVHPSTVGKRKSDRDFGLWSRSRDPDGIPWQYVEDTKMFIPLK